MNDHIIESLYGELSADEERRIHEHLGECSTCREEHARLKSSRDLLSTNAAVGRADGPPLGVASILERAAVRAGRSRRRWRLVAAAAVTVGLLLGLLQVLHVRLEVGASRVSLSWGSVAGVAPADPAPGPRVQGGGSDAVLAAHERRLDELDELIRLMVNEIEAGDRKLRALTHTIRQWIDGVQRGDEQKWRAVRRSIHNLHLADLSQRQPASREGETQ